MYVCMYIYIYVCVCVSVRVCTCLLAYCISSGPRPLVSLAVGNDFLCKSNNPMVTDSDERIVQRCTRVEVCLSGLIMPITYEEQI